ncbi:hypothetical protein HY440_00235 [Candidatus Microgenomates bacterium]|nr:hypothetical protein [Candidatus Microgenomates bacterium]
MKLEILTLFVLNILFLLALWHMDVTHNEDRLGAKLTRGFFKIPPERAYRYVYYSFIAILVAIDGLFIWAFLG